MALNKVRNHKTWIVSRKLYCKIITIFFKNCIAFDKNFVSLADNLASGVKWLDFLNIKTD